MMHKPAKLAGLGEIHDFLLRGYKVHVEVFAQDNHRSMTLVFGKQTQSSESHRSISIV